MSVADRSHTERIRRLRSVIQANRRALCPSCPEEGPLGPTDQSTWLSRRFGQMTYLSQTATGAVVSSDCCSPESIPIPIFISCGIPLQTLSNNLPYKFINNSPQNLVVQLYDVNSQPRTIITVNSGATTTTSYVNLGGWSTDPNTCTPNDPSNFYILSATPVMCGQSQVLLSVFRYKVVNNTGNPNATIQLDSGSPVRLNSSYFVYGASLITIRCP